MNLSRVGTHARIETLLAELRTAVNAVRSGRAAETLSAEAAVAALRLCHREIRSARNRRIERAR